MGKGNGGGGSNIVGPGGQPLHSKPIGIAVLKIPLGSPYPGPQQLKGMCQVINCSIIILPMEHELMMGKFATETLISVHEAIHKIVEADPGELGGKLR